MQSALEPERFESETTKLHATASESGTSDNGLPKRANPNAARLAKLFGYANPVPEPAPIDALSKAVEAVKTERKSARDLGVVTVNPSMQGKVKSAQAVRKDSKFEEEIQLVPKCKDSLTPFKIDTVPKKPDNALDSNYPPRKQVRVVKAANPSTNGFDSDMNMLENDAPPTNLAGTYSPTAQKKESGQNFKEVGKNVKVVKSSLNSLDEMMRTLENEMFTPNRAQNSPLAEKKQMTPDTIKKGGKAARPSVSRLDETMARSRKHGNMEASDERPSVPNLTSTRSPRSPTVSTKEAKQSTMNLRAAVSSCAEDIVASPVSFSSHSLQRLLHKSDMQAQTEQEMESTKKSFLEYMKEVEEMRLERERMDLVHQKILEEEFEIQREAKMFAEEEEQMRRFVENLKVEEERDLENQARKRKMADEKRRLKEEERRAEAEARKRQEEEKKRLQDLEDERLAVETAELLNRENERIESAMRDREARMYKERAEKERVKYTEKEVRLETQRMESERDALEEKERKEESRYKQEQARLKAERLEEENNVRLQRQAEETRVEHKRYKNQRLEAEQAKSTSSDYWRPERENVKKLRQEEEVASQQSRRRLDEGMYQEQRRLRREQTQRVEYGTKQPTLEARRREDDQMAHQGYEEANSGPMLLTKEQETQNAEKKIRAASTGLAQEIDQISGGVKPAGNRLKKVVPGEGEQGQSVTRYNTVDGRTRPRQEQPSAVSRVNTVGVRPNNTVGIGLHTGHKGSFGSPSRPNAGIAVGPRPRGMI